MKRRELGFLMGANLAVAASAHAGTRLTARDPKLLGTSLMPLGGERAGTEDGSIPAWTGGLTAPPLPADGPVDVKLFEDEQPLLAVDASNMTQYAAMLTPGTQAMIQKFGLRIRQYETHRTAAAPQYVYNNTARNVVSAQLNQTGGETGFTGAYGGVPFPIIDTEYPLVGGAQLIWNHLTSWRGYAGYKKFDPIFVVTNGQPVLTSASRTQFEYSFYDPSGSVKAYETGLDFDGYYNRVHEHFFAPVDIAGQEVIAVHSSNLIVHPDMAWVLLAGQGRVRRNPGEGYADSNPAASQIAGLDEYSCFSGSPAQYDWYYAGKQEMLVPYNCNEMCFRIAEDVLKSNYPNPHIVRWEKHRVWVVEAVLRAGEQNLLTRRRLYIDEDSWSALLGEGYDATGLLAKYYAVYNRCVPSIPATCMLGSMVSDLRTGTYVYAGSVNYNMSAPVVGDAVSGANTASTILSPDMLISPQNEEEFDPMSMMPYEGGYAF